MKCFKAGVVACVLGIVLVSNPLPAAAAKKCGGQLQAMKSACKHAKKPGQIRICAKRTAAYQKCLTRGSHTKR